MPDKHEVANGLNGLLADATVFYQKLRHYHWNVGGRDFFTLHEKFELLYTVWADNIDLLAERILMIGGVPLHTLTAMLRATRLEEDAEVPVAGEMVEAIRADVLTLKARAAEVIAAAEATGDRGTVNLLDDIVDGLEKDYWMLGAWSKETAKAWD